MSGEEIVCDFGTGVSSNQVDPEDNRCKIGRLKRFMFSFLYNTTSLKAVDRLIYHTTPLVRYNDRSDADSNSPSEMKKALEVEKYSDWILRPSLK